MRLIGAFWWAWGFCAAVVVVAVVVERRIGGRTRRLVEAWERLVDGERKGEDDGR